MRFITTTVFILLFSTFMLNISCAQEREPEWDPNLTSDWTPVEDSVYTEGYGEPPSDAIVLFDGSDLSNWTHAPESFSEISGASRYIEQIEDDFRPAEWTVENGAVTVEPGTGNIKTKQTFSDIQLHIEWRTPEVIDGDGQNRGNSGVFLQGLYEVQVLDSWQNETYSNGQAGAIYKQHAPMVNASKKPGEWQTYDIFFEAPHFDKNGELIKPAFATVLHNGVLIQHREQLQGPTIYIGLTEYVEHPQELPIVLQDHNELVSFRNIWVREL